MKELEDFEVLFVKADGGLSGVKAAWDKLESKIGSLKGRKFYGAYYSESGEYRACVALTEDDDPSALGLETTIIPGGKYADVKINDWRDNIDRISEVFEDLVAKHVADINRPSLEYYRSQQELVLLLPVK